MAMSTAASPRLKATRTSSPNAMRLIVKEIRSTAMASGHGTKPPEMPKESKLPRPALGGPW